MSDEQGHLERGVTVEVLERSNWNGEIEGMAGRTFECGW